MVRVDVEPRDGRILLTARLYPAFTVAVVALVIVGGIGGFVGETDGIGDRLTFIGISLCIVLVYYIMSLFTAIGQLHRHVEHAMAEMATALQGEPSS